jgi:FecR protein
MVQWLRPATGLRLAILVALAALTACASHPGERDAETVADGWRVIERIGEARHLPPGEGAWRATITGRPISEGSEVATGRGGRLIIAMPGRHISVGPASRFVLPRPDWDDRLEQRAGWLRYRVEATDAAPFRVHTRSLDIEFMAAVLDVRVDQGAVDVSVAEGKVRLATPDGLRRTEIAAGQSAQASGPGGTVLAMRNAPEEDLEAIEPLIIPAVRPTPGTSVPAVPKNSERPATVPEPAETLPARPDGPDRGVAQAPHDPEAPAARTPEAYPAVRPRALADPAPVPAARAGAGQLAASSPPPGAAAGLAATATARAAAPAVPETGRRGQFQRLSEGMIDGVRSPPPGWIRP